MGILEDLAEQKARAELESLAAQTRKAHAEAANAEAQNAELSRKRVFLERILSATQTTIVIGLITLISQIIQFGYTASENRKAEENKEWNQAVNAVSFDGDAKAVSGDLALETFFQSKNHAEDAGAMIAATLPFVKNENAFDHLLYVLTQQQSPYAVTVQSFTIEKKLSTLYKAEAASLVTTDGRTTPMQNGYFRTEISSQPGADVAKTRRLEWEIDTVTSHLLIIWNTHGTHIPQHERSLHGDTAKDDHPDLTDAILRLDDDAMVHMAGGDFNRYIFHGAYLHHADLSGAQLLGADLVGADLGKATLVNAHLDGADVTGANLDEVAEPTGSTWKGVAWWKAYKISAPLCQWLEHHADAPPKEYAHENCIASATVAKNL